MCEASNVPVAATLFLSAATVCTNFTLLSTVSTPFAAWLRSARPEQYAGLALVDHRDAA